MDNTYKDLNLLRPFDLDKVKAGEPFCYVDGGKMRERKLVGGPDSSGRHVIADEQGKFHVYAVADEFGNYQFIVDPAYYYKMTPLTWLEGKPVYKGDTLYYKRNCYLSGQKRVVKSKGLHPDTLIFECGGRDSAHFMTWEKPLTWLEGKPVYAGDTVYYNRDAKRAGQARTVVDAEHDEGVRFSNGTWSRMRRLTWTKPLAFVEGKPVYRGDTLYFKVGTCLVGESRTIESANGSNGLNFDTGGWGLIEHMTWTKPVKPEVLSGWINSYPDGLAPCFHVTKEEADVSAASGRTGCTFVQWEVTPVK